MKDLVEHIEGVKTSDHAIIIVMFDRLEYLEKHLNKLSPIYDIILVLGYKIDLDVVKPKIKEYKHNIILIKRKYDDGPAGGFYIGYNYAIEKGYEYITFAEDDCYPLEHDLPIKIREKGYIKVPRSINNPELKHTPIDFQAWRYATLSRDVPIYICPSFYFFYEDAYVFEKSKKYLKFAPDYSAIHEFFKKMHKRSPFSINNYLAYRNLILRLSVTPILHLPKSILYLFSVYSDLLFMLYCDRKSLIPSILGIIDGLTRNIARFYKDQKLRVFRSIDQHREFKGNPKDLLNIEEYERKGIVNRLKLIIKLLFKKTPILIYPDLLGLQTSIYRLIAPTIVINVEGQYYEISNSKINRLIVIGYMPIALGLATLTAILLYISNIIKLECMPYKYM